LAKLTRISGCYIEFSQLWHSSLGGWKLEVGGWVTPRTRRNEGSLRAFRQRGMLCGTKRTTPKGNVCLLLLPALCPGHLSPKSQFRSSNQLRLSGGGRRKFTCCTRQHRNVINDVASTSTEAHYDHQCEYMYILRTTMPWVWDFLCFQLASLSQPSKVCDIKLRSPRVCDRIILCKRGGIHSHWLVANTSN